jgi:hypothetical protein
MESHVSQIPSVETDKNSYEVIFKFPTMTSMSLFMVEFDQFRKEQIAVTVQEKKSIRGIEFFVTKRYIPRLLCSNV